MAMVINIITRMRRVTSPNISVLLSIMFPFLLPKEPVRIITYVWHTC